MALVAQNVEQQRQTRRHNWQTSDPLTSITHCKSSKTKFRNPDVTQIGEKGTRHFTIIIGKVRFQQIVNGVVIVNSYYRNRCHRSRTLFSIV